jgi:hypothetical protein
VVELKAEKISDDSALNGKKALFGKIPARRAGQHG